MTPSTPTPPLPPPQLEHAPEPAQSRTPLIAVTLLALLTAAVMTVLWLSARTTGNDAALERDNAIAERDAANQATIISDAELLTTQDELADARAALEEANGAAGESDGANDEELEARQEQIDELTAEIERLETENEALATDLADAEDAVTEVEASSSTTVAEPDTTTTTTTTTTTPPSTTTTTTAPPQAPSTGSVSPEEIGDQISGLFRRSVLGPGQKSCLGQVMVNEFGEQRTLDGIASESPRDDEDFVDAIRAAAAFCNIDPSAIFG